MLLREVTLGDQIIQLRLHLVEQRSLEVPDAHPLRLGHLGQRLAVPQLLAQVIPRGVQYLDGSLDHVETRPHVTLEAH